MKAACWVLLVVLLAGCPPKPGNTGPPSWRNGESVRVKADGREGIVVGSYPAKRPDGSGTTEWLVKFEGKDHKPGMRYITEGFLYEELEEVW